MRSRGLVVAIAVVLAIVAAAAVILYTNGVKNDAVTGGALSVVVVSKQDIAANTNLNPLSKRVRSPSSGCRPTRSSTARSRASMSCVGRRRRRRSSPTSRSPARGCPAAKPHRAAPTASPPGNVGLPIVLEGGPGRVRSDPAGLTTWPSTRPSSRARCSPRPICSQILSPAQPTKLLTDTNTNGPLVVIPFKFTVTVVPASRVLKIVRTPWSSRATQFDETNIPLTLDLTPAGRRSRRRTRSADRPTS